MIKIERISFENGYIIYSRRSKSKLVLDPDILHDIDLININGLIMSISDVVDFS